MSGKKSDQTKRDAINVALCSGLTRLEVAQVFNIGHSTLSKWIKEQRDATTSLCPATQQDDEVARLKHECDKLRQQLAIAKERNLTLKNALGVLASRT